MNRKDCPRLILPRFGEGYTLEDLRTACDLELAIRSLQNLSSYNSELVLDDMIRELERSFADVMRPLIADLVNAAEGNTSRGKLSEFIEYPLKGGAK